ncbi:hypothetical protein TCAL_10013 [Tigriopus californicus]|uniref:TRAFD1/XAF1 zinc finger domain-containing protein n=1 Tax=Tigriopus californicus TaxID=6832 RepID=A0A553NXI4_TIGCA|nr:TRAF-type zinc finger domain-containing protein 1-like [Tigriopus californicus]TRY70142.1 hypothetical protein TCAL_10013 [Tigriopus californicus]|eukprot:TCALIF_10013-PA protein Name:"Similar to XAF1 XIAP-associated factor 1 (Homo sapiens)" AED:0.00 eAED:0.00 QI:174/1/1/1/1/1/6/271/753
MGDECEMCQNCKRDIPVVNYQMHMLHCSRNVTLCPDCDEPVPKSSMTEHYDEFHQEIECDKCQEHVNKSTLKAHKESLCSERPIECRFCHLDMPSKKLSEHEDYCGSRTEKCPQCSDYVKLKDWDEHEKMTLYHELAQKPCSQVFGYEPLANDPTWRPKVPFTSSRYLNSSNSFNAIESRIFPSTHFSAAIATTTSSTPTYNSREPSKHKTASSSNAWKGSSSDGRFAALKRTESVGSPTITQENKAVFSELDGDDMPLLEPIRRYEQDNHDNYNDTTSQHRSRYSQLDPEDRSKSSNSVVDQILKRRMGPKKSKENGPSENSWFIGDSSPQSLTDNSEDDGDTLIPCEFCDTPIALIKLTKHQSECTRNMDSLYFNAHLPLAVDSSKNWPKVVTDALYDKVQDDSVENESGGTQGTRRNSFSTNWSSPARLSDSVTSNTNQVLRTAVVNEPDHMVPPPIPPKARMSRSRSVTGAKPKGTTGSSIVSKYLGHSSGTQRKPSSTMVTGPLTTMKPLIDFGTNHEPENLSFTTSEHVSNQPETNHHHHRSSAVSSSRKKSIKSQRDKSSTTDHHQSNGAIPKHSLVPPPSRPPRSTTSTSFPSSQSQPSLFHCSLGSPPGSQATRMRSSGSTLSQHDADCLGGFPTTQSMHALEGLEGHGAGNSRADTDEREKLREMLASLRKDPFDEDLENNDGSFFPCEFCGDPYPSEFIMRHQLSCDLNPRPVSSGDGFDYSKIRKRVKQNMELAKNIPEIK